MRGLVVKLGLLTAAGLGSLGWLAVQIGQLGGPAGALSSTYRVTAVFSDATGLVGGDDVRLAGVRIGKVGSVRVVNGQAKVTLDIDRRYHVPASSGFQLHWRNLLGQRYVETQVAPDASVSPAMAAGTVVGSDRTGAAADLSTLLDNTEPLLSNLDTDGFNRMMATLAAALEGRQQVLGQAIDQSAALVSTLSSRADAIGTSIHDMASLLGTLGSHDVQVRQLLDAMAATSQTVAARSADLGQAVSSTSTFTNVLAQVLAASGGDLSAAIGDAHQIAAGFARDKTALAEGIRTLPWTSSALLRATNSGDWLLIYGRGFGFINTAWTPETRIGPDYSNVGPDSTTAPGPLLGEPTVATPAVPATQAGPVGVNAPAKPASDPGNADDLSRLLAPLTGGPR